MDYRKRPIKIKRRRTKAIFGPKKSPLKKIALAVVLLVLLVYIVEAMGFLGSSLDYFFKPSISSSLEELDPFVPEQDVLLPGSASLAEFDFPELEAKDLFSASSRVKFDFPDLESKTLFSSEQAVKRRAPVIKDGVHLTVVQVQVQNSLAGAIRNAGERVELALKIADVFRWDMDFSRDIHPGHSIRILIEKKYHNGKFIGYSRMLACELEHGKKLNRAYLFGSGKSIGYFDPAGRSLKKSFLKAPLPFLRVTSGFTHNRMHPILKRVTPHTGVDYGAPVGTPVWSVADGKVVSAGRNAAAGNFVRIAHQSNYASQYNHLHRIAKGINNGKRVTQGQLIGYVGSTGLSTGPHLDFRLWKNNVPINPSKTVSMPSPQLPKKDLEQFKSRQAHYASLLKGKSGIISPVAELQKKKN